MTTLRLIKGDITKMLVDVIVNAANSSLLGGGGVDSAIHRAAGPELVDECRLLGGCKTGEAKITKGYQLPAKYIIHTVGPVWNGGRHNEEKLLHNCYYNSLKIVADKGLKSVAFPNISTGIFHFPKKEAANISIQAINDFCTDYPAAIATITIVCFDVENFDIYKSQLDHPSDHFSTIFPKDINE